MNEKNNDAKGREEGINYTEEEKKEMKHLPLKIIKREINYDVLIQKYKALIDGKILQSFRGSGDDKGGKEGDKVCTYLYIF